ncbi:MAG: AraC family transcriptional regulator [Clostridia bacterium]|nr:AraC family transcriptional regulator [Clostridia bacterium]
MGMKLETLRSRPALQWRKRLRYPTHSQSEVEMVYLLQGNTTLTVEGKDYAVQAGDLAVVFPYQIHEYTQDSDDLKGIIVIATVQQLLGRSSSLFDRAPLSPVVHGLDKKHPAISAMLRAMEISHNAGARRGELLNGYLHVLAAEVLECLEFSDTPISRNDITHRVLEYCNEHYREPITLEDLSEALFVSRSYLSRVFGEKLGIGFCEYLNFLRVSSACRMLQLPDCPTITEVADLVGFGSLRNFDRAFQKLKGVTPAEYRRRRFP